MNLLEQLASSLPRGWNLYFGWDCGEFFLNLADWDGNPCEDGEFDEGTPTERVLAALEYAKVRGVGGLVDYAAAALNRVADKGDE